MSQLLDSRLHLPKARGAGFELGLKGSHTSAGLSLSALGLRQLCAELIAGNWMTARRNCT